MFKTHWVLLGIGALVFVGLWISTAREDRGFAAKPDPDLSTVRHVRLHFRNRVVRWAVGLALLRFWALTVWVGPVESPDLGGYRSDAAQRPILSRVLLTHVPAQLLVSATTVAMTCIVVAVCVSAMRSGRPGRLAAAVLALITVSPSWVFFERAHLPDGLFVAALLTASWLLLFGDRQPKKMGWVFFLLALATLGLKEIGVAAVILLAVLLFVEHRPKEAAVAVTLAVATAFLYILPMAHVSGPVLTGVAPDSSASMHRFRQAFNVFEYPNLTAETAAAKAAADQCDFGEERLVLEILAATSVTAFDQCPEFWNAVDGISTVDVLLGQLAHPGNLPSVLKEGFFHDPAPEFSFTGFAGQRTARLDETMWLLANCAALAVMTVGFRRQAALSASALFGLLAAAVLVVIDPSGQSRHSWPLRSMVLVILVCVASRTTVVGLFGSTGSLKSAQKSPILVDAEVGEDALPASAQP